MKNSQYEAWQHCDHLRTKSFGFCWIQRATEKHVVRKLSMYTTNFGSQDASHMSLSWQARTGKKCLTEICWNASECENSTNCWSNYKVAFPKNRNYLQYIEEWWNDHLFVGLFVRWLHKLDTVICKPEQKKYPNVKSSFKQFFPKTWSAQLIGIENIECSFVWMNGKRRRPILWSVHVELLLRRTT